MLRQKDFTLDIYEFRYIVYSIWKQAQWTCRCQDFLFAKETGLVLVDGQKRVTYGSGLVLLDSDVLGQAKGNGQTTSAGISSCHVTISFAWVGCSTCNGRDAQLQHNQIHPAWHRS